jgi:ribosomal protein L32
MAVPKKKISVSRKKTRLYSKRYILKNFRQCSESLEYIPLHSHRLPDTKRTTNLINKYNLDFL